MFDRNKNKRSRRGRQFISNALILILVCSLLLPAYAADKGSDSSTGTTAATAEETFVDVDVGDSETSESSEGNTSANEQQAETSAVGETAGADAGAAATEEAQSDTQTDESSAGKTTAADSSDGKANAAESEDRSESSQPAAVYSAECEEAEVTVEVQDGAFTEPVTLFIETVADDSEAYRQAEEVLLNESGHDGMLAFDIYFRNESGQEIEPLKAVNISIKAKMNEADDISEGSLVLTHIDESGQETAAQVVASESEGTLQHDSEEVTAEFVVESFSIYTLTWNNRNAIEIHCIDESGNEIGSGYSENISNDTTPIESRWTDKIAGYTYVKAVVASSAADAANGRGTEIRRLRRNNNRWQYNTSASGNNNWRNVGSNTVYFIYEPLIVDVCVYVAGKHLDKTTNFSQEMLDLLQVNGLNAYGYYAAGTLQLDLSKLSGTSVSSMIQTQADWDYVLGELKQHLDTTKSKTDQGNLIANYAEQVLRDLGKTQNAMWSGLWVAGAGNDISDGTIVNANGKPTSGGGNTWHLDLRFDTVKITYIYGNNGITGNVARDGTEAGSKVFIKGATMDYTPTIQAPPGYKIVGYYKDPDCTDGNEWDAVGQPINEDTNVYIKIVPMEDVVINYVVQEGEGTVTNPDNNDAPSQKGMEHFNPRTGTVKGSTATPSDEWEFDGWYSDPELTNKVSSDSKYVPSAPAGGWKEDTEFTYYAKFVRKKMSVNVTKEVSGNMGDTAKDFSFTLTDEDGNTREFDLKSGESEKFNDLSVGTKITLTEKGAEEYNTTAKYGDNSVDPTEADGKSFEITLKEGTNTIVVTNQRIVRPPTGILTNNTIYLAMLAISALFAAAMFRFTLKAKKGSRNE